METPARGFPLAEYERRLRRAQTLMAERGLAALLLTTEPDVRYFSGFLTRFWESPTRPWYVVVPAEGDPIAVIPAIGAPLMERCGVISDIRTWPAPYYDDDGISLLASALPDGPVGTPSDIENSLRMPLSHLNQLSSITDDRGVMRTLRLVKSPAEIEKITAACTIADRAFAQVEQIARPGVPLERVFRDFQRLCLDAGADWVPYLAGAAGPLGYDDVISPATETPLAAGDILMLDTGVVWDGYFCDFDRNFAIGAPDPRCIDAHAQLIEATQAAFDLAAPGVTCAELFAAMDSILTGGTTPESGPAGRLGHGLGMQLTEWPSILPYDHTPLAEGMVMTLEPATATINGKLLVHEENIVITRTGASWLTTPVNQMHII